MKQVEGAGRLTDQQLELRSSAEALLLAIDNLVPGPTIHYAVEAAKRAASVLAGNVSSVQTHDYRKGA